MYMMGGVTLLLVGGLGYVMVRDMRKKKITFGEWLNENFLRQQVSWIIILLGLIILSEGLLAATIPVENEFVNPVARLIAHISIAFLSLVIAVGIPRTIIDTVVLYADLVTEGVKAFQGRGEGSKKKKKSSSNPSLIGKLVALAIVNTAIMVITGYMAVYLPYWNIAIIANGLGELEITEHAFYELIHNRQWMLEYYKAVGIVAPDATFYNYRPFEEMSMTMAASWVLFMAHVVFTIVDGLYATKDYLEGDYKTSKKRSKIGENLHETINERGERAKRKKSKVSKDEVEATIDSLEETLQYMVEFTEKYESEDKIEEIVEGLEDSFFDIKETDIQNILAANTARLYNDIVRFSEEEGDMNDNVARQRRRALIKKVEDLAKGSTRQGEGYGRPLPR